MVECAWSAELMVDRTIDGRVYHWVCSVVLMVECEVVVGHTIHFTTRCWMRASRNRFQPVGAAGAPSESRNQFRPAGATSSGRPEWWVGARKHKPLRPVGAASSGRVMNLPWLDHTGKEANIIAFLNDATSYPFRFYRIHRMPSAAI